jgi:hypothetical protein
MRKGILGAGLFAFATLSGAVAASAASLVADGGFESGTTNFTTSFALSAGAAGAGTYEITTAQSGLTPNSGTYVMAVNGFDAQDRQLIWQQGVDVVAGVTYDLSGFVGTWANGTPLGAFDVIIGGALVTSVTAPSADDTRAAFGASWTASATQSVFVDLVETANSFGATDYALDDLAFTAQVSPIPLPAGLPLLAIGLGALALARRRVPRA